MTEDLWIDTSVVWSFKHSELARFADLAKQKRVRLVVHAQVHLEMCRRLRSSRRAQGKEFSASYVDSSLTQLHLHVADFLLDRRTAEAWAALLDERHPGDAWRAAKLAALRSRLPEDARLPAEGVPMTADWHIALEVERVGARIAVDDQGSEWAALRAEGRALSRDEAVTWLHSLPDAPRSLPDPEAG
jgi:hypothetical protein